MKKLLPYFSDELTLEAGVDEVGRGCIAGPVVAAAVILDPSNLVHGLRDSKKLSARARELLSAEIIEKALGFAIASASAEEIDEINILQASFLAMNRAIKALQLKPGLLLVDGNRYRPDHDIPFRCIIKGDDTYQSIAAASILAKTYRDTLMSDLDKSYPAYGWAKNVGYPTARHLLALHNLGITVHHRRNFGPCRKVLADTERQSFLL
jgi:ribonuclease HII